jgi:hypothetical protein
LDGDTTSCWCEGASGYGIGESVTFSSSVAQPVQGFVIWNGYQRSEYVYGIDTRPKTISVYADNGYFVGSFTLTDSGLTSQNVSFGTSVTTKSLTIEITSVYPGSKCEDCCISEIEFY